MSHAPLKVVVVGLGPIGRRCIRAVRFDPQLELVGLVDTDPQYVGRSAADIVDTDMAKPSADEPGPTAVGSVAAALDAEPDVAVVSTSSCFEAVAPILSQLAAKGVHAVSSCEEMAWPAYRHAMLAQRIDREAREGGAAFLGTGVNPGFVMDTFAVTLASMVRQVHKVRCVRRVNAALRREPLQRKAGATLSVEQFQQRAAAGTIGHKGIAESVALLAAGLGHHVEPGSVTETLEPVVATQQIESAVGFIAPGMVCGMHNTATWSSAALRIELDLTMALGEADPKDIVKIEGPVSFCTKIPGGLHGDSATIAALMNQLPNLPRLRPGLRTMLDAPPAGCRRYGMVTA